MVTAAARTKIATGGPGLACGPRSPQNYAIVIAGAMPASLGGHRESHLLLCRLHGCRRRRSLFAWAFHRVRMGLTCEPHRISRPLFSFSVDVLGTRCVDYQTKIRAAARVADAGHRHRQSSSASRFTAAVSGFFILSQSGERPEVGWLAAERDGRCKRRIGGAHDALRAKGPHCKM